LPVEFAWTVSRCGADAMLILLGYRRRWLPTPEGWISYWINSRGCDSNVPPCVFLHGVGMGVAPYTFFCQSLREIYNGPMVMVELPNASRSSFQPSFPSPASYRDALERILKELGGPWSDGYVLVGHSLGTDYCACVLNDPRGIASPILPGRLVLLDPICFIHELPQAHRISMWSWKEARQSDKRMPSIILAVVLFFILRDEYQQQAMKRGLAPGTDFVFRAPPEILRRCRTMVCISGSDAAIPGWQVHDYVRAQFPDIAIRMDPVLEHGGFLFSFRAQSWVARSHLDTIATFITDPQETRFTRTASLPEGQGELKDASVLFPVRSNADFGQSSGLLGGTSSKKGRRER